MVIIYCRCAVCVCWKPHKITFVALQRICRLGLKMLFTFNLSFEESFLLCIRFGQMCKIIIYYLKAIYSETPIFRKKFQAQNNISGAFVILIFIIDKTIFDNAITQLVSFGLHFHLFWMKKIRKVISAHMTIFDSKKHPWVRKMSKIYLSISLSDWDLYRFIGLFIILFKKKNCLERRIQKFSLT